MYRDPDDDDYRDSGQYGGGVGTSSKFGGTSNFNTTMLSDDGRFLGIKLSKELAQSLNLARGGLMDWASRKGEQISIPLAEKVALQFTKGDKAKAFKTAGKVGNMVAYGIILSGEIANVGRNIYDTTDALNNLRIAVKPLGKANGGAGNVSPISGNNEVVANARAKINSVFWQRLAQTATGSITILPTLLGRLSEQKEANVKREKNRVVEHATSEEELATILEQERRGITTGSKKITTAEKIEKAEKIMVENARKEWLAELEKFKKQNLTEVSGELQKALEALDAGNIDRGLNVLNEHGFDTGWISEEVKRIREKTAPSARVEALRGVIEEYQETESQNLGHYVDEALTAKYVRQNGAFDDEWTDYSNEYRSKGYGSERKLTHKEKIEAWVEKRIEEQRQEEQKTKGQKQNKEISGIAAGLGAAVLSELAAKAIGDKKLKKYSQPIAIDRILHLRRVLEQAGDNPPEQVAGIEGRNERDMGYVRYVHNIFEQHQRDSGRPEIGDRFFEHFENARWDDAAVQQLPDEQLTAYEYAVKTIAKRIKDGRMDAIALVSLVGDKNNKIVRDNGRMFGARDNGRDEAAAKAALLKVIDEQTALVHAGKVKSDADVNEKLGNFVFSVEDIKKALETDALSTEERAFIFTLFSDVVGNDKQLCKMLGITDDRCQELRKEKQETFNDKLDGAVLELADRVKAADADLEKIKLTEKEKTLITTLAERIREDGKHAADLTENRQELKALETVALNAPMAMDKAKIEGRPSFLSRVLERAKEVPGIIAEAKKRREEQPKTAVGEEAGFADQAPRRDGSFASEDGPTPLVERAARSEEPVAPGRLA